MKNPRLLRIFTVNFLGRNVYKKYVKAIMIKMFFHLFQCVLLLQKIHSKCSGFYVNKFTSHHLYI